MKILFIVTQSELGGAQRFVFEAAKYFSQQGYEVAVAAGEGGNALFAQFSNEETIKTHSLKHLKRTPGPITALLIIKEITRLLKTETPNVLFLCSTTAGILGSVAASSYKKRQKLLVVYRIGGWAFRDPRPWWQNKIILWLEKLTGRFKDKIIVNSEIDRELAIKHGVAPAEKLIKIYNGVDTAKLQFLPKEEAMTYLSIREQFSDTSYPQIKLIGCVANFYKTKGLEYLVEAARLNKVKSGIENLKYIVIGDGRGRKKLEQLIKKYGLEQTFFLPGRIADAYKYLKAFDVFVLPSLKEGFPWIILEAMAGQIPIVATTVGALPEIIEDNKEGMLVRPGNSTALSEKIAWLLEHPTEAQKMAALAREKVEQQFTLQKMLEQTAQTLK